MYYPPMKLRRKKSPSLNDACNRVENMLRRRTAMEREAGRHRDAIEVARARLEAKEGEMAGHDGRMGPALERVK